MLVYVEKQAARYGAQVGALELVDPQASRSGISVAWDRYLKQFDGDKQLRISALCAYYGAFYSVRSKSARR